MANKSQIRRIESAIKNLFGVDSESQRKTLTLTCKDVKIDHFVFKIITESKDGRPLPKQAVLTHEEGTINHDALKELSNWLKLTSEFSQLQSIVSELMKQDFALNEVLSNIISYVAREHLGETVNRDEICRRGADTVLAKAFARAYEITIFGCEIEGEPIEIEKGPQYIRFRCASREDLEVALNEAFLSPLRIGTNLPECVITTVSRLPGDHGGLSQRLSAIPSKMLGLFAVGWIDVCVAYPFSHHLLWRTYKTGNYFPSGERYVFKIDDNNKDLFVKHCLRLWDILIIVESDSEYHYLGRCYDSYKEALASSTISSPSLRITNGVRALEALLLSDDTEGIGKLLRLRTGVLSDLWGGDPEKVDGTIKRAYAIRSQYVHGVSTTGKQLEKFNKDVRWMGGEIAFFELVRKCLLVSYLLGMKKDDLIKHIHDAMVSSSGRSRLNGLYKKNCANFLHEGAIPYEVDSF